MPSPRLDGDRLVLPLPPPAREGLTHEQHDRIQSITANHVKSFNHFLEVVCSAAW